MFSAVILTVLPLLALILYERLQFYRLRQFAAWPQLQTSLVFGHLKVLHKFILGGNPKRHIDSVLLEIKKSLGDPPLFILDLRPIQRPLAVICSHDIAEQISGSSKALPYSLPKSPTFSHLKPLIGRKSILTAYGEEWKILRKRFNPGFAPQHLMGLVPCMLDKTWDFLGVLDKYAASGEDFSLEDACIKVTFDIVSAITIDGDLSPRLGGDRQSELGRIYRELFLSYRTNSKRKLSWLQIRTGLYRRRLAKQLDTLLDSYIKTKFTKLKTQPASIEPRSQNSYSIISLCLHDVDQLDSHTLAEIRDQLKTFLLAGHDSTTNLLQWIFYELSRTPRVLAAVRRELNDIFGPDSSPEVIRDILLSEQRKDQIHRMTYTSAVIKEVLRLHPPAATARYLPPGSGFNVNLPDGNDICLDGAVLYNCSTLIQRDEKVYGPTSYEFRPERWLENIDTSMQTNTPRKARREVDAGRVPPSAWRPFERGPRNCIGQDLANLEVRLILACTVRRYKFEKVGLGKFRRDDQGNHVLDQTGQYEVDTEVFSTMQVTAKPVDGMRVKVHLERGVSPLYTQ